MHNNFGIERVDRRFKVVGVNKGDINTKIMSAGLFVARNFAPVRLVNWRESGDFFVSYWELI